MSTVKSCLDCPSLLGREEAQQFFGVATAAPMCSRFGHVYGPLGTDEVREDAATKMASGCPSFGQGKAATPPANITASWWTPRTELLEPTTTKLQSCSGCNNFDTAKSACAATGRIIFQSRKTQEATNCAFASTPVGLGQVAHAVPVFIGNATTFTGHGTPPSQKAAPTSMKKMTALLDPTTYSSDAPVSDDHKAQGIRAWFKHETPRGKVYYLPIFDPSYFGERAELIPSAKNDHADPSLYIDHAGLLTEFAVQVYRKDLNLVAVGEAGTGKTEGVRYLAWRLQMPFERLSYNEASEPDQFLGLYQFDPTKGTYFEPGYLPLGWVSPGFLLSDEPNLAPEAIMQAYRSMNDSSRELVIYRERFRRHDYCFHIMAINPHWDFRNIGTKPLASADSRRLSFFWMPHPDKDMLRTIISTTVEKTDGAKPDAKLVTLIIKIGEDLRQMAKEGTLPDTWTVSQDVKVARLVEDFGLEGAYRRAYFNYIDPQDAEPAMAAIKSHVPYGSEWE